MNTTIAGLDTNTAILIAVGVVAIIAIVAVLILRRRKSVELKSRFGPEYARAVETTGGVGRAEADLQKRAKRVATFDIRPLTAADREHYVESWGRLQTNFVDNPKVAVTGADELIGRVMTTRGYPVAEFEQASADLSVDHPKVVENYRAAHDIALRLGRGEATTEDLRQAMIHYRGLFDELVTDVKAGPLTAAA
jgi:LPXTG-motif cell wall-anchored protein